MEDNQHLRYRDTVYERCRGLSGECGCVRPTEGNLFWPAPSKKEVDWQDLKRALINIH